MSAANELAKALRAVGKATRQGPYAVTTARRAQAAAQRLARINDVLRLPETEAMIAVLRTTRLNLNNGPELNAAADRITAAAETFDRKYNGSELGEIDSFIP
jgi:hypothetical protein